MVVLFQLLFVNLDQAVKCVTQRIEVKVGAGHWLIFFELDQHQGMLRGHFDLLFTITHKY